MPWDFAAQVDDVNTTTFWSGFSPDPDYVWMANNLDLTKRRFNDLTDVVDFYNFSTGVTVDFLVTGIAPAPDDVHLFVIGWQQDGSQLQQIWRVDPSVGSPTRSWSSGVATSSPGGGYTPALVYRASDDRFYFHWSGGFFGATQSHVSSIANSSDVDQTATLHWSGEVGPTDEASSGLTLTQDNQLMWKSYDAIDDLTIWTYSPDTDTVDSISVEQPVGSHSDYDLAHAPDDPTAIVYWDETDESSWQVPSDVSTATEVVLAELHAGLSVPHIRGVSISQDLERGVLQISEATVQGGNWYTWESALANGAWTVGKIGWPGGRPSAWPL